MAVAISSDKTNGYAPPPPISRQKTFIVENADILDTDIKKAILRITIMEVGREVVVKGSDGEIVQTKPVIMENVTTREVSINLDNIDKPEVVLHIYNIISNRRVSLNEPVHGGKH